MKTLYVLFLFAFLSLFFINAQAQSTPVGARSAAMGNASVCNTDIWGSYNNQAGLGFLNRGSIGVFYENRYILKELSYYGAAIAMPTRSYGTFGISFSRMGYSQFNRNKASFVYARKFGERFSAGMQFNYLYTFIGGGYGSTSTFSAELGLLAKVTDQLSIGFHLNNPVRAKLATYNNERLPTVIKVGISYNWVKKLLTSVEFEKDIDMKPSVRAGLEYKIIDELMIRAGGGTGPIVFAFGLGMAVKGAKVDIACSYHQILGFSPQGTVSFDFGKPIKKEKSRKQAKGNPSF